MHWIDPQSLPSLEGTVAQCVMNRDGEIDGLLLVTAADETKLVHFPPHMGGEVETAIKVGDTIAVHGVRPRGAEVIAAVSLVTANGAYIVDRGPNAPHAKYVPAVDEAVRRDAETAGRVRLSICGPKGEVRGAILEDGTVIRVGKREAVSFESILQPGAALAARGTAIVCAHGTMLDAEALGAAAGDLKPVKDKNAHKPEKPKKHAEDDVRTEA